MKAVDGLLADHRIVTLTGSVASARPASRSRSWPSRWTGTRRNGWSSWLRSRHRGVVDVIAAVLGMELQRGRSIEESLLELRRREPLVLDNCEHVVREKIAASRSGCGDRRRRRRRAREACAFRQHPAGAVARTRGSASSSSGRSRWTRRSPAGTAVVALLCSRLTACPWRSSSPLPCAGMFSIEKRAAFDECFRLLTGGRGGVERHHTLRALVIDGRTTSTPVERFVFARLSVFAGGCTLEAGGVRRLVRRRSR